MTENGVLLHSAYNPEKEAQRFVETLTKEWADTPVSYIVITGASLSYCVPFLRSLYPHAKLYAIQYTAGFEHCTALWDRVFTFSAELKNNETYIEHFCEQLYVSIPEEDIPLTRFVSWEPSERAHPILYTIVWKCIKKTIQKNRDVLTTRAYFTQRWTKNIFRFCARVENVYTISKGTVPILLIASGPSLENHFDFLREYGSHFFIIALSSALEPLVYAGIIPDCCISTDGGYWAKNHLLMLETHQIPLLLSAEGTVSSAVLTKNPIIPLSYGDSLEMRILQLCGIPAIPALRNGSVAGTGASLALTLSDSDVFALGLDLCTSQAYNHARPNNLDVSDELFTNRTFPTATQSAQKNFSSAALDVYASWFASRPPSFTKRFFRMGSVQRHIPSIAEISEPEVIARIRSDTYRGKEKPLIRRCAVTDTHDRRLRLQKELASMQKTYCTDNNVIADISFQDYLKQKKGESIDDSKIQSILTHISQLYT